MIKNSKNIFINYRRSCPIAAQPQSPHVEIFQCLNPRGALCALPPVQYERESCCYHSRKLDKILKSIPIQKFRNIRPTKTVTFCKIKISPAPSAIIYLKEMNCSFLLFIIWKFSKVFFEENYHSWIFVIQPFSQFHCFAQNRQDRFVIIFARDFWTLASFSCSECSFSSWCSFTE